MVSVLKRPRFFHDNIVSMQDLTRKDIEIVLKLAKKFEKMSKVQKSRLLKGKRILTLFLEPSTRTRLSFEAAALNLGAQILSVSDSKSSSFSKGETLEDTVKICSMYSDLIVLREPDSTNLGFVLNSSTVPIINAGNGFDEHPTQALTDLFTIQKRFGRLTGLNIAFVGDLKFGRTVHSLSFALGKFPRNNFFLVSPKGLEMPKNFLKELDKTIEFSKHSTLNGLISKLDVLYMTRLQRERFKSKSDYKKFEKSFTLKKEMLNCAKKSLTIMHPLPRVEELPKDLDLTKHAYYFEQASFAIFVREALLFLLLKKRNGR